MMTAEVERDLLGLARGGDRAARDAVFANNLPLVKHVACRYRHQGHNLTMDDLIQEGSIGLLQAISHYRHERRGQGNFGSYAALWIKQSLRFAVYSNWGPLKVPLWTRRHVPRFREARDRLGRSLDREPTPGEIARELGITTRRCLVIGRAESVIALWTLGEEALLLEGAAGDQESVPRRDEIDRIRHAVRSLPEPEATWVTLRFDLDHGGIRTLKAIREQMGLSVPRCRQVGKSALCEVRSLIEGRTTLRVPPAVSRELSRRVGARRWMLRFSSDRARCRRSLLEIEDKYAFVLRLRYCAPRCSFREIAAQMDCTEPCVMRLEQDGIMVLQARHPSRQVG